MRRTVLQGGSIFDGAGADPVRADVAIEGDRIVATGTGLEGDEVVDCTDRTILPGLIDCHVHLMAEGMDMADLLHQPFSLPYYRAIRHMAATLGVGITTIREAGGADLGVREAQRLGLLRGPRMQISITMLCQTGGHNDPWEASGCLLPAFIPHPGRPAGVVDGPDEARRKVRELIRAGADVIKIATSGGVISARDDPRHAHFRTAEVAVIVEEATAAQIAVMSHAGSTDGIKMAVRNGVRSIEHGDFLDDEAIQMMLDRGTWLVPTLIAGRGIVAAAESGTPVSAHILEKAHMVIEAQRESVRRAVAAGVRIAFGTDSGVTRHGDNLDELALMVDCGMTPGQALHAATLSAARLLGLDRDLGSIEVGKLADLVIVSGDALRVQDLAGRIGPVYQAGDLVATGRGHRAGDPVPASPLAMTGARR